MTNTFLKQYAPKAVILGALMMAAASRSAQAVTLEQKWQPGQQLDYNVLLNGTVNLMAPADAPFFLAGVPMKAKLDLKAQTTFDALSVDDNGTGTVALRVADLQVRAEAFGGAFVLKNGRTSILMNGAPLNEGRDFDMSRLKNPPFAMLITKQGRVTNLVPTPNKPAGAATAAKPGNQDGQAFDPSRFVIPLILRALPTVWPAQEVKIGDKWQGEIGWPVVAGNDGKVAPAPDEALPTVGKMDFTLEAEEEILGRKTHRVAIEGDVVIDAQKAASVSKKANEKTGMPRLTDARQEVKGKVWLDAAAGQVVRADLKLQTVAHGQGKSNGAAGNSYANFEGTLTMELNKVSYAGAGVAPVLGR